MLAKNDFNPIEFPLNKSEAQVVDRALVALIWNLLLPPAVSTRRIENGNAPEPGGGSTVGQSGRKD